MKSKLIDIFVKIFAAIIAFMIILRFGYVFYDFIINPFHPPVTLGEESVKHIMTALILLELLALTLKFFVQELIDPNLLILTVLTALGRDIIVMNFHEVEYTRLLAIGVLFAITILGLYLLKGNSH